jgi:hypothetical protein
MVLTGYAPAHQAVYLGGQPETGGTEKGKCPSQDAGIPEKGAVPLLLCAFRKPMPSTLRVRRRRELIFS